MALPADFNTGLVKGHYVGLDGVPIAGQITFKAQIPRMVSDATDTVILTVPLVITLDENGSFSVNLPATNDADINPTGFTYEVTENFGNYSNRFNLSVPVSSITDISEAVAIDPATGQVTLRGVQGYVGPTPLRGVVSPPASGIQLTRNGKLRVDYESSVQYVDSWAGLTGWTQNAASSVQASANKVYADVGGYLHKAWNPTQGKFLGSFVVPATAVSTAGYVGMGVKVSTANDLLNMIFIGIKSNNHFPAVYANGVFGAPFDLDAVAIPAGTTMNVMIGADTSDRLWLTMRSADRSLEYRVLASTRGSFTRAIIYNADPRDLTGLAVGPVMFTDKGQVSQTAPKTTDVVDRIVYTPELGDNVRVVVPGSYDSRIPAPLVMYHHGSGGTALSPQNDDVNERAVMTALADLGYIVASCNGTGVSQWGNDAEQDAYYNLYQFVAARWALGPVLHYGKSMGGLSSLLTIANRRVPSAGWYGLDPVCSLQSMYAVAAAQYQAAYGIAVDGSDYASKTLGHDPLLIAQANPSAFGGLPMRFCASPGDTLVYKAANTDPMRTALGTPVTEQSLLTTSGAHVATTHFVIADVTAFFARCTDK